jgi:Flp pilus assembly pilin Flp
VIPGHKLVAGIEWDSRVWRCGAGPWNPERRHQVERAKLFPIRLYLALQGMRDELQALRDDESGQAMVEYALILALVSVAAIGILKILGSTVSGVFSKINGDLGGV